MNAATESLLKRYMAYDHLPAELQKVAMPLCVLAYEMATVCDAYKDGEQLYRGFLKLIEAKDCFVRAMLP